MITKFFQCYSLDEYVEYLAKLDVKKIPEVRQQRKGNGCHRVIGKNAIGFRRYGYAVVIVRLNN